MRLPRILLAAPASGGGKTSLTLGLLGALKARGVDVRAFKAGPDYIDPALHAAVLGRPSRNLDLSLMGREAVLGSLNRNGQGGMALIEGVMGLFDGSARAGSTADLAAATGSPVIIVIDCSAQAESAGAVALGFSGYRRDIRVSGFILNRIAGRGHYETAREAVAAATGLPVLGFLPSRPGLALPERHLGLVWPGESGDFRSVASALAQEVGENVDLEALLAIAASAPDLPDPPQLEPGTGMPEPGAGKPGVRIAVARDLAFSFYYEDNFDLMRQAGLEPVFFSPLADSRLPAGAAGIYLGGGYPELHAKALASNAAMRDSIRKAAADGMPIFAECGGYLYLLDYFEDMDSRPWPGCAILPGRAAMGPSLAGLGYREGRTAKDGILGPAGTRLQGHVFHFSRVEGADGSLELSSPDPARPEERELDGSSRGSAFGSYLHLHFAGNRGALASFAAACASFSASHPAMGPEA